MKRLLLLYFLVSNYALLAQNDTLVFDDGTKLAFEYVYDDPYRLPKWQINCRAGLSFFSAPTPTLQLKPKFIISKKLFTDFQITLPYTKYLDASANSIKLAKMTLELYPQMHYELKSKIEAKITKKTLKFVSGTDHNTAYRTSIQRNIRQSLLFDSGLNFLRTNAINGFISNLYGDGINYYLLSYSRTSVTLGFSYFRAESYNS